MKSSTQQNQNISDALKDERDALILAAKDRADDDPFIERILRYLEMAKKLND